VLVIPHNAVKRHNPVNFRKEQEKNQIFASGEPICQTFVHETVGGFLRRQVLPMQG
jgi:hypothetical protein